MMINIITLYSEGKTIKTCRSKNYDFYHKGRGGSGHRIMVEILISENDDNDGRPLTLSQMGTRLKINNFLMSNYRVTLLCYFMCNSCT